MKKHRVDDQKVRKVFAANLKKYLSINHIQQKTLAKAVDVSEGTICDWIKGKGFPRVPVLQAIADYFRIKISDLLEEESVIKEKITIEQRMLLDLYNDIPVEKRGLVINVLNSFKEEPIPKEKQELLYMYDNIPSDKKELLLKLLTTLMDQ